MQVIAAKPDNQSWTLKNLVVEGENQLPKVIPWPSFLDTVEHTHTHHK